MLDPEQAKFSSIVTAFSGAAAGTIAFGLPWLALPVAVLAAGASATVASVLCAACVVPYVQAAHDEGTERKTFDTANLLYGLAHMTVVPASAVFAVRYALKATGFVP